MAKIYHELSDTIGRGDEEDINAKLGGIFLLGLMNMLEKSPPSVNEKTATSHKEESSDEEEGDDYSANIRCAMQ